MIIIQSHFAGFADFYTTSTFLNAFLSSFLHNVAKDSDNLITFLTIFYIFDNVDNFLCVQLHIIFFIG